MSAAAAKGYISRGVRYLHARGVVIDERVMFADRVTPRQRRRLFHKERRWWRKNAETFEREYEDG